MKPVKGITFFHDRASNMVYAETHKIMFSEEKNAFLAVDKKPMRMADLELIFDIIRSSGTKQEEFSTYTEKVLAVDWGKLYRTGLTRSTLDMVWYTEPQKFHFFFPKNFNPKSGIYHMPYLVWKLKAGKLSVFASKEKPSLLNKTALYRAPMLNIYTDGKVCMGSTKVEIKNSKYLDEIAFHITKCFFSSEFTHTNTTISKGIAFERLYELSLDAPFDTQYLLESNETLEKLCTL